MHDSLMILFGFGEEFCIVIDVDRSGRADFAGLGDLLKQALAGDFHAVEIRRALHDDIQRGNSDMMGFDQRFGQIARAVS